jgi:hypothetical protein
MMPNVFSHSGLLASRISSNTSYCGDNEDGNSSGESSPTIRINNKLNHKSTASMKKLKGNNNNTVTNNPTASQSTSSSPGSNNLISTGGVVGVGGRRQEKRN